MTSWTPDLTGRDGLKYQALLDAIAEAIRSGALKPGDKLPPQRDLAWKLGMTVGTVGRAYALAEERRLVSGQVGRGTYVLEQAPAPLAATPGTVGTVFGTTAPGLGGTVDLTHNTPPIEPQIPALAGALQDLARAPELSALLNYMPETGHTAVRAAGRRWIQRVGLDLPAERLIVAGGAQHALAVIQLGLVKAGDTILSEHMTYGGIGNVARLAGAVPRGIAVDAEGALPEALDRAARETGARVVFLTPTIHSPTTATMGEARRREIAAVLRARDLVLVEDDVYGYLPERRPAPIATLAPERVVYLASLSKCLAPGLRIAWMAPPPGLVARLSETLHATALALPAFAGAVAARWIADGTADRIVGWIRGEIAQRQAIAAAAFRDLDWRTCPGAMHGFVTLPDRVPANEVVERAAREGILLCAGTTFAIDPATAPNGFRVTLGSTPDRGQLRQALETIAALAGAPAAADAAYLRRHVV